MPMTSHCPPVCRGQRVRAVLLLAGALLAASWQPAQAGALFRWTDADGSVHFSDSLPLQTPPAGFEGERPQSIGEALDEEVVQARIERREATLRDIRAEEKARERAALEESMALEMASKTIVSPYTCEEARDTLAAQRRPRRTYFVVDENGVYQPRTAEQAKRAVEEWEQAVEQLCAENVRILAPGSVEAGKALADAVRYGGSAEPVSDTEAADEAQGAAPQ